MPKRRAVKVSSLQSAHRAGRACEDVAMLFISASRRRCTPSTVGRPQPVALILCSYLMAETNQSAPTVEQLSQRRRSTDVAYSMLPLGARTPEGQVFFSPAPFFFQGHFHLMQCAAEPNVPSLTQSSLFGISIQMKEFEMDLNGSFDLKRGQMRGEKEFGGRGPPAELGHEAHSNYTLLAADNQK